MPVEFDDSGLRIIGNNVIALGFYDDARTLQQAIYLESDNTLNIGDVGTGVSGSGSTTSVAVGGAPDNAQYLVLSLNDGIPNCRRLDIGAGLTATDMGAGADYDLSVNTAWAPTWTGAHTFTAATAIQNTLTSYSIVPATTDTYDIGTSSKLFRKAYISELEALVFAENTVSLIGGWLVVPHDQGSIAADLAAIDDTCDFGKAMTADDWVLMRAFGQVEYFLVGANVAGTVYKIGADASGDRDIDGSGANAWPAGTAFLVMGAAGDGRIELNSAGPNISVIIQGAAYNTTTEPVKIDSSGLTLAIAGVAYDPGSAVKWGSSMRVWGQAGAASTNLWMDNGAAASETERIHLTNYTLTAEQYSQINLLVDTGANYQFIRTNASLYINDVANTFQAVGLTINQAANDDEALALKSSDVAHGMTDFAETDTFYTLTKRDADAGGAQLTGYRDAGGTAGEAVVVVGRLGEAADTTK
ncbi:MAG TPA: hypothetical protein VM223_11660, partial [Planctomycetota bacterium]|nr:hypothetical protein [Planctomycetota bacterium]